MGHVLRDVIIARAHSSFSLYSAVAVAMIASFCAAARLRQGIEPLRSRCCVVVGEITHLTLLLNTAEGKRDIPHPKHDGKPIERHVVYAAPCLRRYGGIGKWVGRMSLAACLLMGLPSLL